MPYLPRVPGREYFRRRLVLPRHISAVPPDANQAYTAEAPHILMSGRPMPISVQDGSIIIPARVVAPRSPIGVVSGRWSLGQANKLVHLSAVPYRLSTRECVPEIPYINENIIRCFSKFI